MFLGVHHQLHGEVVTYPKTEYSQIRDLKHIAKGIPAGTSQIAHHLFHAMHETWFCSLPSCVLPCLCAKLGCLGPRNAVYD